MSVDASILARARYFGVRHHSPRATRALVAFLDEVEPAAVLVEGPEDAGGLLDVLVDAATEPPVAILGYRTEGAPRSALWPFATYSPEYAALRWTHDHGAHARFVDLPVRRVLSVEDEEDGEGGPQRDAEDEAAAAAGGAEGPASGAEAPEDGPGGLGAAGPPPLHPYAQLAADQGFRSFEELWEARFEAPPHDAAELMRLMDAFAGWTRALHARPADAVRDAYMARGLCAAVEELAVEPERIAVVMGAAHVAAFRAGDVDPGALARLPPETAAEVTLIPYSFPRLAEQLGYGAGNRAPMFYQRAADAGCDFHRATLEVLLEVGQHLRLRGFSASLADTIEAYRLARRLAELRDKPQPGLDEVREGAVATLFRGDTGLVDELLWPAVVGKRVGRVAARIGRNSLQQEFWSEVKARRLPQHDEPEAFTLQLHNEVEIGTSIFLHRLRVSRVPYAVFLGTRAGYTGGGGEEAGGLEALRRVREAWEAQWTPSTDVALAESIALGETLEQVATRRLEEGLRAAASTGAAADLLCESVVAGCPRMAAAALAACDRFAAGDDDLPSLARACQALSGLVSFGSSRTAHPGGDEAVTRLCVKTFDRSVVRLAAACVVDDAGVPPVADALRGLHEVATSQPLVDRAAFLDAARGVAASYAVHPSLAGLAAGLLYLAQALDEAAVALLVEQRLSDVAHPDRAASFLDGFLAVNALVLVRNRDVVRVLDAFLAALPADRFRSDLPVLRRAFARLGPTERRYLLENVVALRGGAAAEATLTRALSASEAESLSALDAQVGEALDDLDDLL